MNKSLSMIALAVALGFAGSASAGYKIFSGIDNGGVTEVQRNPINSQAREVEFKALLTGVSTEDFEGRTGTSPLSLTFTGAGTATLQGSTGYVEEVDAGETNGAGRYSAPGGTKYWEVIAGVSGTFEIAFSGAISAFGFYGVDIGDFQGTAQVEVWKDTQRLDTLNVPAATSALANASILFFGLIGEGVADDFNRVRFVTTTGNEDRFAFDTMTIGSRAQLVCPPYCPPPVSVPTPGTLPLVALALLGLGVGVARRRA
jgi:hypothetical protein